MTKGTAITLLGVGFGFWMAWNTTTKPLEQGVEAIQHSQLKILQEVQKYER